MLIQIEISIDYRSLFIICKAFFTGMDFKLIVYHLLFTSNSSIMKQASVFIILIFIEAFSQSAYSQSATAADKAFIAKVSQGGMFEVAAGKLAMTKGDSQDTRDFATAEVHDHKLVAEKLKKISQDARFSFSTVQNAAFSSKLNQLSALSGKAFDHAYFYRNGKIARYRWRCI